MQAGCVTNARAMAVSRRMQVDLLSAAAVEPRMKAPIAEPRDVRLMRIRIGGADLSLLDLDGGAQRLKGDILELLGNIEQRIADRHLGQQLIAGFLDDLGPGVIVFIDTMTKTH